MGLRPRPPCLRKLRQSGRVAKPIKSELATANKGCLPQAAHRSVYNLRSSSLLRPAASLPLLAIASKRCAKSASIWAASRARFPAPKLAVLHFLRASSRARRLRFAPPARPLRGHYGAKRISQGRGRALRWVGRASLPRLGDLCAASRALKFSALRAPRSALRAPRPF